MSDGGARPGNGNEDPLLVRRFVLHPDEVDETPESAYTWPAPPGHVPAHRADSPRANEPTAIEPGEPTAAGPDALEPAANAPGWSSHAGSDAHAPIATGRGSIAVVLPGTTAGDRAGGPSRRRVLLIAGLVVLVAIALAAVGIAVINGGDEGPRALPTASARGTTGATPGETTPGGTPATPGGPGEQGPGQPGPGAPGLGQPGGAGSEQAGPGNGIPTGPGGANAAALEISRTTLAQTAESSPPAEPRSGAFVSDDNRCLGLPGGKPRGHHKYALIATCDGTDGQTWTLDPDGTVRLGGKCALAEDTAIRISGCGNRREAQWRAGPGGILLNVSTGWCLTDQGDAVLAECTGAANQRWALP